MKPKISVITPSFNQAAYIKDTIESVLAQRYEPFEHIVMDGGSTDGTVEILKQYPHLQWVSEKDEGQSDALNKGLARATGEIVAWINSDDWYEPGTFDAVAEALKEYPVVMGKCAVTDDKGKVQYEVPNVPRIWFDLLKYWVPYSIPTQPAIFFRKNLLPALERNPGLPFDKELYYTMDYDLWLRMSLQTPLINRIDRRVAYYRMTETNKTGAAQGGMSFAEPEMARVFKRAETIAFAPSFSFSVIIPVRGFTDSLARTIESVLLQSSGDFEIVLAGTNLDADARKKVQQFAKEKNAEQNRGRRDSYLRFVNTPVTEIFSSLEAGFAASEGRHVVVMTDGVLLGLTFLADALQALNNNRLGLLLPWKQSYSVYQALVPAGTARASMADFAVARLFDAPALPLLFVARRAAMLECGDLLRKQQPQKVLRELVATMLFKGWHVHAQQELRATAPEASAEEKNYLELNRQRIAAEVVVALDDRLQREPFARARAEHGCALVFDQTTVKNSRELLERLAQAQ